MKPMRTLLLYAQSADNASYSYLHGWPLNVSRHPRFACTAVNLLDEGIVATARRALLSRWRGDAVVFLHSVASNAGHLSARVADWLARIPAAKAYFIGNEYKHVPEKLALCQRLGVALFVSQTRHPRALELYRDRLRCEVMGLPNTGLDTDVFQPGPPRAQRPIDLGYRSDMHGFYLGHTERGDIADYFTQHAGSLGLVTDISTSPGDRFAGPAWAAFLNRCKGQLGTEAGTDYFTLSDDLRLHVNGYVEKHPEASFADVWSRFFRDQVDPVPMRIISGRNVEAAGTKTVQMLFEGGYDGYLQPDEHYIPLKKDFSNAAEAVAKFRDDTFCDRIANNAYQVAVDQLTYPRLIDRFADALAPLT